MFNRGDPVTHDVFDGIHTVLWDDGDGYFVVAFDKKSGYHGNDAAMSHDNKKCLNDPLVADAILNKRCVYLKVNQLSLAENTEEE